MVQEGPITIDFSQVEELKPLDEAQPYLCTVTAMKPGRSKASNEMKVHCEFTIDEPEMVGEVKAKGRKLFREFSLQPKAAFGIQGLLSVLGEDPEELKSPSFLFDPEKYLGLQLTIMVRNEEYEERVQSRPRRLRPASAYSEVAV